MPNMVRSMLAILAGIIVLTVISFAIEFAFNAALPGSDPAKLWMTAYTFLSIAVGGYTTACLAPKSPIKHSLVMGAVETLMTIDVMYTFPGVAPLWTWLVSIPLIIPAALLGARFHKPSERAMIL
ncbi:MAG: hypothetical protein ABIR70_03890 [Bryobacteraceae bacterium]